jgi:hypothetical protein
MGDVARYIKTRAWKEVIRMNYERPEVLATYTEEELVEEAAVCMTYGPGGGN